MGQLIVPTCSTAERLSITPSAGEILFDEDLKSFWAGDGATAGGVTLKGDTGATGAQGPSGAGGDMFKADNLAGLANVTTARTNLGLATVAASGAYADLTGKPTLGTAAAADTGTSGATVPLLNGVNSWSGAQRSTAGVLVDGATITPDFSVSNDFSVTLAGSRTLANPTNLVAGQSGHIAITQDTTGSRTLAFGSYWKFGSSGTPSLSTAASAKDVLAYWVMDATHIVAALVKAVQ